MHDVLVSLLRSVVVVAVLMTFVVPAVATIAPSFC